MGDVEYWLSILAVPAFVGFARGITPMFDWFDWVIAPIVLVALAHVLWVVDAPTSLTYTVFITDYLSVILLVYVGAFAVARLTRSRTV